VIAKKLQDFYDGKYKRMMLFAPPRCGKSEIVSRLFPAWLLGVDPDHQVIACSHTAHFASSVTKDVVRIMKSDAYADIFPQSYLRVTGSERVENRLSASGFDIPGGTGSYSSAGAGGNIVGRGANTLILDDIIKSAEHAGSQTQRDKLNDWYGRDALTRLEGDGKILIINTRQHEADICGHLLEKAERDINADKWEVVSFPAIDAEGKALWPDKYPIEVLSGIKAEMSSMAWAHYISKHQRRRRVRYSNVNGLSGIQMSICQTQLLTSQ